jgi:hypothetical protein
MPNLFVDDLDKVTVRAVRDFLGLDGPLTGRMREGYRVDFKGTDEQGELNRKSTCKAVAAFSNSYGGLVFVGVQEDDGYRKRYRGCITTR